MQCVLLCEDRARYCWKRGTYRDQGQSTLTKVQVSKQQQRPRLLDVDHVESRADARVSQGIVCRGVGRDDFRLHLLVG